MFCIQLFLKTIILCHFLKLPSQENVASSFQLYLAGSMQLKNKPDPIEEHLLGLFKRPGLAMRRRALLPTEQMMCEATCTGKPVLERRRITFRIIKMLTFAVHDKDITGDLLNIIIQGI